MLLASSWCTFELKVETFMASYLRTRNCDITCIKDIFCTDELWNVLEALNQSKT